ncbi:MAG: phosphoglycerate mutase family protein, partial [Nanoarchaeota archaeon]
MKLYIVRHAQSKRNAREESVVDAGLTDIGKEQAKRLGLYFKKVKIDAIFCSNLIRARDTLKGALPYLDPTLIQYTDEIVEHKMGIYGDNAK